MSLIPAYEVQAACRGDVRGAPREREDLTAIVIRQLCRDERSSTQCALHDNGSIRQAGNDAVALHEVEFLNLSVAHELRQESTLIQHLNSGLAMQSRIDFVKAMREHAHRGQAVGQGRAMCRDVYSVGQSTDDKGTRLQPGEVCRQTIAEIPATFCAAACAHDADNPTCIQVNIP